MFNVKHATNKKSEGQSLLGMASLDNTKSLNDNNRRHSRNRFSSGLQELLHFGSVVKADKKMKSECHLVSSLKKLDPKEITEYCGVQPIELTIGVMGETSVGKTALIIQMTQHKFTPVRQSQSKTDTLITQVDGLDFKLKFMDCEAEFLTSTLHREQLQDMQAFLFVFDSENSVTDKMINHLKTIREYATLKLQQTYPHEKMTKEDIPFILAYNNRSETQCNIPAMISLVQQRFHTNAPFISVNAKTGENVELLISQLVRQQVTKKINLMRRIGSHGSDNKHCITM